MGSYSFTPAHSPLGGSGAYRWINCPGSPRLCASIPRKVSKDADEGTAAHSLAQLCLESRMDPMKFVGNRSFTINEVNYPVTAEMAQAVKIYVDHVLGVINKLTAPVFAVELKVSLGHIHNSMFGIVDSVTCETRGVMRVFDYKHGAGVFVEVKENPQLLYYAVGCLEVFKQYQPQYIELNIVQPRSAGMPIRSWTISINELIAWRENVLRPAVARTFDPTAPLIPGEWCRKSFCPAQSVCPVIVEQNMQVAQQFFTPIGPPPPAEISVDRLAKILTIAPQVRAWLDECESRAHEMLSAGQTVPGFKLVEGKGSRQWKPDAEKTLLAAFGPSIYAPQSMLSVPQMENVINKELLKEYWQRTPGRPTLAPETDSRKSAIMPAFTPIPDFLK